MEAVYLVGHSGPEHNEVLHVCRSYETAWEKFHEIRKQLIADVEKLYEGVESVMAKKMIANLSEVDPEKIDNYPHETPYIQKRFVIR